MHYYCPECLGIIDVAGDCDTASCKNYGAPTIACYCNDEKHGLTKAVRVRSLEER